MKVCHVCSLHTTDDGRVFHRACAGLAEAGYEVHLLAAGKGDAPFVQKGVTVHPLPPCTGARQRFSRLGEVARKAAALKPDLFHVHEPELVRAVLDRAGGRPVVYDVHESYLDVLAESDWLPRPLRPLAGLAHDWNERQVVPRCAAIVAVNDAIAQRYRPMNRRVRIVHNFPDFAFADLPLPERDGRTLVYAGAMSPNRGLSQVLRAMALLKHRDLEVYLDLAAVTPDDPFVAALMAEAEVLGVREQVRYYGTLPQKESVELQRRASIGLVTYLPLKNSVLGLPNKLCECMALGLAVIFSEFPMYCRIAGDSAAGIPVDPTDPEAVAGAIERLVRDPDLARRMGEAGRRAIRERYNWRVERRSLLDLYEEVLGATPCREPVLQVATA